MNGDIVIHHCSHIGVAGTTAVFVKKLPDGNFEARVGIAIMGYTNISLDELENASPFDASFQDNYAAGTGNTEEAALSDLKNDMRKTADSLWMI